MSAPLFPADAAQSREWSSDELSFVQEQANLSTLMPMLPTISTSTLDLILIESQTDKRKRTKNFVIEEDDLLCCCYLSISQDPLIGKDQRYAVFWKRIHEMFQHHNNLHNNGSQNSLMNRWTQVQKAVNKFCGVFAQIAQRKVSGKT